MRLPPIPIVEQLSMSGTEDLDRVDVLTESIEKIRPQASQLLLSTIRAFILTGGTAVALRITADFASLSSRGT